MSHSDYMSYFFVAAGFLAFIWGGVEYLEKRQAETKFQAIQRGWQNQPNNPLVSYINLRKLSPPIPEAQQLMDNIYKERLEPMIAKEIQNKRTELSLRAGEIEFADLLRMSPTLTKLVLTESALTGNPIKLSQSIVLI